ncbi:hypothetical protein B0H34DRAFT_674060 [Crassisporium funariophilum]|nr:hypothetical protein B0H34DRAFT_674060 [Crassisporium funariophilum]
MDIDWCLTCEKRVEGSSPYCSPDCQSRAGPSTSPYYFQEPSEIYSDEDDEENIIFHPIDEAPIEPSRWTGNDSAGISAWAAEIPAGAPAGAVSSSWDDSSSLYSSSSATYRPPNLLKPNRQAVPPSLCTAAPQTPSPPPLSTPMVTPKRHNYSTDSVLYSAGNVSMGQTSLRSAATESSLATPASSHPMPISGSRKPSNLGFILSHVQSWVPPTPSLAPAKQRANLPAQRAESKKFTVLASTNKSSPVKVVSSPHSQHGFSDENAICWMSSTILLEQPSAKRVPSRGRRFAHELPLHDEHPSFRARGRKASRAVA